jgi:hypothetical protein
LPRSTGEEDEPVENQQPAPGEPPADLIVTPVLDRVLAVGLFAVVGGVVFGILATLMMSWEAVKNALVSLVGGGQAEGWDATATWVVCSAIALGVLGGAWFGWDITRTSKRRRRGPRPHADASPRA